MADLWLAVAFQAANRKMVNREFEGIHRSREIDRGLCPPDTGPRFFISGVTAALSSGSIRLKQAKRYCHKSRPDKELRTRTWEIAILIPTGWALFLDIPLILDIELELIMGHVFVP